MKMTTDHYRTKYFMVMRRVVAGAVTSELMKGRQKAIGDTKCCIEVVQTGATGYPNSLLQIDLRM